MGALLYTIVFVQLMCHLPRTALNMYEIYMALIVGEISLSASWLVDMSHLLLAIASASNVAIFAALVDTNFITEPQVPFIFAKLFSTH